MLNQTILVGRLTNDLNIRELEDGRRVAEITLAVQRNFKNPETNEYDTDFIKCTLWQGIADSTQEYCKKGSVIGVKARISMRRYDLENEKYLLIPEIIAERITFISTKRDN